MQNIANKISIKFHLFVQYLKLIRRKQPVSRYILFQDFFSCEVFSRKVGYTFLSNSPNKWMRLNGILGQLAQIFMMFVFFISIILSIKNDQLYGVIENFLMLAILYISLIKIYVIFFKNMAVISKVIEKLDEHFPHSGVDQVKFDAHKYWKTSYQAMKLYNFLYYTTIPYFCLMPILHQIYAAYVSMDLEWETIFALNLGFDQLQPIFYVLICIFEAWITFVTTSFVLCSDLLYANLVQILAMEFEILAQIISEIDFDDGEEEETVKEIKKLVNIHQELVEAAEQLNDIFSLIILVNCFGSITAMCTACFLSVVI